jgi:hypothetical protein
MVSTVLSCGAAASSWVPISIAECFTALLLSIEIASFTILTNGTGVIDSAQGKRNRRVRGYFLMPRELADA